METKNTLYLMVAIFIVLGIILYFVYKALYERNLNRVLQHKKARKLPSIWVVLIVYGISTFCISAFLMRQHDESYKVCSQNKDYMVIDSNNDHSLNDRLASWMLGDKAIRITKEYIYFEKGKTEKDNHFDLFVGEGYNDEVMYFLTYKLHDIDATDQVLMQVFDQDTNQLLIEKNFKDTSLQNGDTLYYFVESKLNEDNEDCIRSFKVKIIVDGKKELTTEQTIHLQLGFRIQVL